MLLQDTLNLSREDVRLHIDAPFPTKWAYSHCTTVIDCETDEKDNFVGLALTQTGKEIYYYTRLNCGSLEPLSCIGHNLKGDIKWLKMWGVNIRPEQIAGDTMLMSYCQDPTKEKHGLKSLAKSLIGLEYPDYRDIVGKGRGKITLDAQPVETVANYCGYDVLATYRLHQYFDEKLTATQRALYQNLELPLMRLLYQMELQGIQLDVEYLKTLQVQFATELSSVRGQIGTNINLNSPKQVKHWLETQGIKLKSTDKKYLSTVQGHKAVDSLREYRELAKLKSTYVDALLTKNVGGTIYTTFNQLIDTGR